MSQNLQISVIVPLFNEAESLPELHDWIVKVMKENSFSYEILFMDDGSTDNSWDVIQKICSQNHQAKGRKFVRNYGKTAALQTGFIEAKGDVIITMDADLQDSPDEIPALYKMIAEEKYDLVSGWKQKRYDPITKTLPTKLFNGVSRWVSGVKLHDFNCGLKAYHSKVVKNITIYGEMHRNIPIIAKWNGFKKIGEKVVQHQARKYGKTKFGLERFIYGFLDLLTVAFVNKFGRRPMHFFGTMGVLSFFIGTLITIFLITEKLINLSKGLRYRNVTDNPLFYLALVAIIIGSQLFLAGFVGELFIKQTIRKDDYLVDEKIN